MSEVKKETAPSNAVATREERGMQFIPFGGKDAIKLNVAIIKRLIAVPTRSGKTCSDDDAIKFMMMCSARRLNPFEGDAFLIGYDTTNAGPKFSLITAHQAFLKRAELNPEYDGMESGVIIERDGKYIEEQGDFHVDGDKIVGGWAKVFFKNRSKPMYKRLRLARFKRQTGIWTDDPAGMICKCAEADALRSSFPTMLGGLYLKEEIESEDAPKPSVAVPIFKGEARKSEAQTTVNVEAAPTALETVRENCRSSSITEEQVLHFMDEVGLYAGAKTLDEVSTQAPSALDSVVSNWDSISARLKEEKL